MNKIIILDGYNLFYRARYSGMNRGEYSTIFNFFRSLRPLVENFKPTEVYCVLEGSPKKRLQALPEYKGQREYHDKDNFNFQRNEIIRLLKTYFPIQVLKHNDFECDDVISNLSNSLLEKNDDDCQIVIVSSDTDFIQSISKNVFLYNPVKKSFVNKPDYDYVIWKALRGDASDNIQGFKGVGDKRAKSLMENKEKLKEFITSSEENKEKFKLNSFLIKFHEFTDAEMKQIRWYQKPQSNWEGLKKEFTNMSFNSIIGKEKSWNKFVDTFKELK